MIRAAVQLERGGFTLDVRFEAARGVTGLFGASGAGKSTLIALLAGLERPGRGTIEVDGETLFDRERGVDIPTHRRRIGVVFQEHRLFPHMSVRGNIGYAAPRGEAASGIAPIVDLLELGSLLDRRVTEISGGERQRVALARALASRPRVLLLDEPLASLDLRLKGQILPYLQRVRDSGRVPMLYVSHDLTEILQLTDDLMVLERGRLVGHGRYGDLVHDAAVLDVVRDRGMRNVFEAVVARHEPAEGLSVLRLGVERLLIIPRCAAAEGERVTVGVYPWDIALAASPVEASIQNQLPATVTRCTMLERSAMVEVDVGTRLVVEVSRRSAARMGLQPGRGVVCLIKSHAVREV